jgi:hypothetical protein
MLLHWSAYHNQNLYRADYSGHMHHDSTIERLGKEYVNTHIPVANCRLGNSELADCDLVTQVAVLVEVTFGLVLAVHVCVIEVHTCHSAISMSADSVQCGFRKLGIRLYGSDEAWPAAFPSQPSPPLAQETPLPSSSLLVLKHKVL